MRKACPRYPDAMLMECPTMLVRSIVLAAALTATAAFAEPAKPQSQESSQTPSRPVVLASAEGAKAPVAAADQQAPAKRPRVARVTTCRCGDPVPQEDDSEQ
jgi:hypothetical protein